jgi:lipopolysaccharide transport system permease protein
LESNAAATLALDRMDAAPPAMRRLAPSRGWRGPRPREIWRYRELLYFLVARDVQVRYKQTLLGAGWALIQPVMAMVVFTVFFGRLAHVPSDGLPYPVFSMAALVPWTYFASALGSGSTSLSAYQHIMSKVYFPRLLIPMAAVAAPLVDFAIAFVVLLGLMFWYGVTPGAAVVWLPALMMLAAAAALAASIWLSALNVRYRDVRFVVPFALQIWMFATPVAYPASLVPARWRALYGLNPMAGVIEGFRWALVGGPAPGLMTLVSALVVAAALLSGVMYFRRFEGTFVDVI